VEKCANSDGSGGRQLGLNNHHKIAGLPLHATG
jgi:hypothetical protein